MSTNGNTPVKITTPKLEELSRSEFFCGELKVIERIYKVGDMRKIVWVRDDPNKMEINGKTNNLVHVDYTPDVPPSYGVLYNIREQLARRRVQEAFIRYWS